MREQPQLLRWTKWIGLVLSLAFLVAWASSIVLAPAGGPGQTTIDLAFQFSLFAVPTCILWWMDWNPRRLPRGHCQHCGYSLTGNVSGLCPECGTPVGSKAKPRSDA